MQKIFVIVILAIVCVFITYEKKQTINPKINQEQIIEEIIVPDAEVIETPEVIKPDVVTEAKTLPEALKMSEENNKNIFMYMGASWCYPCQHMKSTTLVDADVKISLKKFVVLMLDADENKKLAKKFGINGIPTSMILDKNGKVLKSEAGYKEKKEFLNWLISPQHPSKIG